MSMPLPAPPLNYPGVACTLFLLVHGDVDRPCRPAGTTRRVCGRSRAAAVGTLDRRGSALAGAIGGGLASALATVAPHPCPPGFLLQPHPPALNSWSED